MIFLRKFDLKFHMLVYRTTDQPSHLHKMRHTGGAEWVEGKEGRKEGRVGGPLLVNLDAAVGPIFHCELDEEEWDRSTVEIG